MDLAFYKGKNIQESVLVKIIRTNEYVLDAKGKEVRYIRHDGYLILESYDELVIENGLLKLYEYEVNK